MFFDTHCHLDDKQFDADREEMFARAIQNGVTRFVNISYDLDSSKRSIALAHARPDVRGHWHSSQRRQPRRRGRV